MNECVFCKIVKGEIPCQKVFENNEMLAFKDIHPAKEVHLLLIAKRHIESLFHTENTDSELLGKMLLQAKQIAKEFSPNGFRLVINTQEIGGQEVPHLHFHIVGGKKPVGQMFEKD